MNFKQYLSLIFFCISTSITPGPNNLMIMLSGLNHGIKKSLPHYYGICFGFCMLLAIVGLGCNTLLVTYSSIRNSIKVMGITYMVYLMIKTIFASTPLTINDKTSPISFVQAVLLQWVNPKVWMMATGVFAAFNLSYVNNYKQTIQIILIFGFIVAPMHCYLDDWRRNATYAITR